MRRLIFLTVVLFAALTCSAAEAGIIWDGDFYTFRYAVDKNGENFFYIPTLYVRSSSATSRFFHNPSQGSTAPYNAVALGDLIEFNPNPDNIPGEIRLRGMAKGPEGGVSPANGLVVQGFAEILPSGLDANHGVDIEQKVLSWVTRRFSVNRSGTYNIGGALGGLVNFTDFGTGVPFFGRHSVGGTVELLETLDDWNTVNQILSFPVSEFSREYSTTVNLVTNGKYELKVVLNIETDVLNYSYSGGTVAGALPAGDYKVGETGAPMVLSAIVYDPNEPELGLPEAIKILQVMAGLEPAIGDLPGDLSGDGRLGLAEVIYALQKTAGLR